MLHRWRMIRLAILLVLITGFSALRAADSLQLPPAIQQQLLRLQQENKLGDWLNAYLDYIEEAPLQRIDVLMHMPQLAWRSYQTYPERLIWFDMLALQGYYQLQTGNILTSITAYEKALAFYEAYPLPDAQIIEYVLKPLGNNYTRLADYGMALYIHRKTLALAVKANDRNMVASVLGNMAVSARWQGDFEAATLCCRQAIIKVERNTALQGLLYNTYADVLTQQLRYDSAQWYCGRALQQLAMRKDDAQVLYWYGGALQQMAGLLMYLQKPKKAMAYIQQAAELYRQHYPASRQREKAKLYVLYGNAHLQMNKGAAAAQCFIHALQLLLPRWQPNKGLPPSETLLYGENTLGDALEGVAKSWKVQGNKEYAFLWFVCALQAQAPLRQAFFYTASKLREIEVTRNRADAAMELGYALWKSTAKPEYARLLLQVAELSKAQVLWEEQQRSAGSGRAGTGGDSIFKSRERLQQAIIYYKHELLERSDSGISNLLQDAEYKLAILQRQERWQQAREVQPDIEKLMASLPDNVIALEFFEGASGCFLLSFDNKGVKAVTQLSAGTCLQDSIQLFLQTWFMNGPAAMMNAPQDFYTKSYQLYKKLFPGSHWLKGKRYLVIPDGVVSLLPFDAFITREGAAGQYAAWPFLFKEAVLSRAYSLQSWVQQQQPDYKGTSVSGFFVSARRAGSHALLTTGKEYTTLAQRVKGTYYFDSLATLGRFKAALPATQILQVSMHATLQPEPLLYFYDSAFYLSDLRFSAFHPSLVVLGACRTADGGMLKGEGINSLQRGFVAAGAGGVLGSLWNVNDTTAVELLQLFYQYLSASSDAGVALHRAKTEWLQRHKTDVMLQLPYYWAAFEYTGHLKPVALTSAAHDYRWIVGAAVLLLGIVLWGIRQKRARR